MGVFGKGVRAGHHGSCPLLQLAQFLASFIQCYSGTCQVSDHTRGCPLHALNATWARDVLGQASRCFSSCQLTNWMKRVKGKKNRERCVKESRHQLGTALYLDWCRFGIHSSSLSSDCAPPPKRPLKNPLFGASGVSTGVKSSPSISWNSNTPSHYTAAYSLTVGVSAFSVKLYRLPHTGTVTHLNSQSLKILSLVFSVIMKIWIVSSNVFFFNYSCMRSVSWPVGFRRCPGCKWSSGPQWGSTGTWPDLGWWNKMSWLSACLSKAGSLHPWAVSVLAN